MKEAYIKSLRMIKILNIKNKKEYNRYKNYYEVLSIDSLKWISGIKNFQRIIELAEEVWMGFFFCKSFPKETKSDVWFLKIRTY